MTASWCVLVPQKSLALAKSRLGRPSEQRRALAEAFLADTVTAIEHAQVVVRTVVVWDAWGDRSVLPDHEGWSAEGRPLNPALRAAAQHVATTSPGLAVAVVPADLPGLDAGELTACLGRAERHAGAFLRDSAGCGTTIVTAGLGSSLQPAYGADSAAAHRRRGLHELSGVGLGSLRRDVDDVRALLAGLPSAGPRTSACWRGRHSVAELVDQLR